MAELDPAVAGTSDVEQLTSDEIGQPTIKKKQRMSGQKTCRVCGDRALAHNFDVISCESCKAFFRRNALKTKIKPCAFKGECEITLETRRFCAYCRLQKCLQSGMKAEMILVGDEKKARQEKLAENRRKREEAQAQQQQQQQQQQQPQQQQQQQPQQQQQRQQQQLQHQQQQQPHHNYHHHQQQQQQQQPPPPLQQSQNPSLLPEAQTSSNQLMWTGESSASASESRADSCTSPDTGEWYIPPPSTSSTPVNRSLRGSLARSEFLERAKRQATLLDFTLLFPLQTSLPASQQEIDESFQHIPHEELSSDPHKYWRLSDEERALLTDITVAYQHTVLKLPENTDCTRCVNVESILYRCQRFATDIVNFVKKLPDFRELRMQDQVAVLKGASWRTFLVKSSANFVVERNAWIKDNGYLSVEHFMEASPEHRDKILLMAKYSAALKYIIRNDPTTFAVLQVLVLFDPRDPNLGNRQLVSEKADKYALLLKHLLQSQWSYDYAGYYLNAVRGKVQEMAWVADSIQVMFMDWVHLLEPLMREVLNLS